jgi:hypothetical protein
VSELREAAQAVVTEFDDWGNTEEDMEQAIARLRAALAQPEAEAEPEPVAWLHHAQVGDGGDGRTLSFSPDYYTSHASRGIGIARESIAVVPLYAHPPRDEWRLASEPPDSDRDVQAWIKIDLSELDGVVTEQCDAQAFYEDGVWHVRGPDHDGWMQLCPGHMVSVVAWRDVTPPTEGAK